MNEIRLIDANALKEFAKTKLGDDITSITILKLFGELIDNAPTVEPERPQGEWIDANKQIPEDCITVLIWFEYYRYGDYNCMYQTFGLGYTIDGKWSPFINGETGWRDAHIIAWQPIEPYGADMKGEE